MMTIRVIVAVVVVIIVLLLFSKKAEANESAPEVRITYGHFLDGMLPFTEHSKTPGSVIKKVTEYQKVWNPHSDAILTAMIEKLGCSFKQAKIDVYIVGRYNGAFSEPLVMSAGYDLDEFVPLLAHEIAHRLLTDNEMEMPVGKIWAKMFPNEDQMVRNHIVVFALLRHVFDNALKRPDLLMPEYAFAKGDYKKAWDVVDTQGYNNILMRFRHSYTN